MESQSGEQKGRFVSSMVEAESDHEGEGGQGEQDQAGAGGMGSVFALFRMDKKGKSSVDGIDHKSVEVKSTSGSVEHVQENHSSSCGPSSPFNRAVSSSTSVLDSNKNATNNAPVGLETANSIDVIEKGDIDSKGMKEDGIRDFLKPPNADSVQLEMMEPCNGYDPEEENNLTLYKEDLSKKPRVAFLLPELMGMRLPEAGSSQEVNRTPSGNKLGTMAGVYLPCLQNILGVILFLRLSWIVGEAGIIQAFFIVFLSCCCTMITAISMSAIATNGKVPAGGSYYMISRSLGPAFGGSVGILFYLGTTFASSLYILGAVEILVVYIAPEMSLFGEVSVIGGPNGALLNNYRIYGTILLFLMASVVFVGVKYVNKFAFFFLGCVLLSLVAIYVGCWSSPRSDQPDICFVNGQLKDSLSYCNNVTINTDPNNRTGVFVGIPGLESGVFSDNAGASYRTDGETNPGVQGSTENGDIPASEETSFAILIGIFFPSVTGIMAGSNRSGDLRNAQRSIPIGTIAAIATTTTIYLTCVLFFGGSIEGDLLRDKYGLSIGGEMVIGALAWPTKWLVLLGALLSTVGAGLQSLVGAPRLLQAIANDDVIPILGRFKYITPAGEPLPALILTCCISEIGIIIANLDVVAPIITMFFLLCYAFVNVATTVQSLLNSPNWRPRFKYFHWSLSLLGACLCVTIMFLSSWVFALAAVAIAIAVYKYIEYKGAAKEWGDGMKGLSLHTARLALLKLKPGEQHTKNWRPQILVLSKLNEDTPVNGDASTNISVEIETLTFVNQLKHGRGLTILGSCLEGTFGEKAKEANVLKKKGAQFMKNHKLKGFFDLIVSEDVSSGLCSLVQTSGLGGLRHNTVCINWPDNWKDKESHRIFIDVARTVMASELALLVPKGALHFPKNNERMTGSIDIWWVVHDGGMLLLLPFLLKKHKVWKQCKLRIFTVAELNDNSLQMKKDLEKFIFELRLEAEIHVIEMSDNDISAYTYERTLIMERRQSICRKMNVSGEHDIMQVAGSSFNLGARSKENLMNAPDNVKCMNTSVKLNGIIKSWSAESALVLLNLPTMSLRMTASEENHYMEFIDVLTEGLKRVLLVKGGGSEVVTIYS
eukprot:Nk52_evm20s233 gene=Nk52_evmTU20s233